MSAEQKPFQTLGVRNRTTVNHTFVTLTDETCLELYPLNFFPAAHFPPELGVMHPLQVHQTEDLLTLDYHQPTWDGNNFRSNGLTALNVCEANQNFLFLDDTFAKSKAVHLVPPIQSCSISSVMASSPPSNILSIKHKHQQLDPTESSNTQFNTNDDGKRTDSLDCPICGRKFVYPLNFAKHLASSCCQPPCKKTRLEPEIKEPFKSNTLPRASRSKKVTRSNSTKSRKKQQAIHPPLHTRQQNCQFDPETTSQVEENSTIISTFKNVGKEACTSPFMLETSVTFQAGIQQDPAMCCDFCQLHFNEANIFQRHRLAHALVIQLTRCLQLSLLESPPVNETNITSQQAVQQWLTDQVRVNFNDLNWLKQAVKEVEQVLNCSNMDVDIRQRHGIADENEFQNVVDLLATQEFNSPSNNVNPYQSEFSDYQSEVIYTPSSVELSESGTSFTYDSPSTEADSFCSDVLDSFSYVPHADELDTLPSVTTTPTTMSEDNKILPDLPSSVCESSDLDLLNGMGNSNDSLFLDINAVEKQMADLLKSLQFSCSECGRCFSQPELMFQHMCLDHFLTA